MLEDAKRSTWVELQHTEQKRRHDQTSEPHEPRRDHPTILFDFTPKGANTYTKDNGRYGEVNQLEDIVPSVDHWVFFFATWEGWWEPKNNISAAWKDSLCSCHVVPIFVPFFCSTLFQFCPSLFPFRSILIWFRFFPIFVLSCPFQTCCCRTNAFACSSAGSGKCGARLRDDASGHRVTLWSAQSRTAGKRKQKEERRE